MKLSLFVLAATSLIWLGQALPVVQDDVSMSSGITSLDKRGKHDEHDSDSVDDSKTSSSSESGLVPGKYFDRVVIIVFENKDYKTAMKNDYLKSLPSKHNGVLLTNYRGTSHPSQPNYVSSFLLLFLLLSLKKKTPFYFIVIKHANINESQIYRFL